MCIGLWRTITIVLIGILTCKVEGGTIPIDLEKNFCESRQTVTDNDVYEIKANPRSDLPSGRDHCNVFFTASPPIRKFYLYIRKLQIADCGVSLKIYDGDPALKTHRWSLSCEGPPQWKLLTWYGNIAIRLEKYTSESANIYDIDVLLTTDQGPAIDIGTDANMEGLSTGAIVGIAVGAGVAILFIVGFILFFICRMYSNDKDDKKYPSTVFSTAPSRLEHGFLKPGSSRASSTGHRVEFLGIGANEGRAVSSRYSATGSYRTRSSQSYENSAYTRSEDESSTDVVDGKYSASPGMRKKSEHKEPVSSHVSTLRQSSNRKKNDQISTNSKNEGKSENTGTKLNDKRTPGEKEVKKDYQQKRTNGDDDERSKSYSKSRNSEDQKEISRKDTYRDKRPENGKSRLYAPERRYHSDDDDDNQRRQKVSHRVSSRSTDNRGRSKYDREYNSSTSQGSTDYREEKQRSSTRRRHRDDSESRYRERSESRSRRHEDSRERSHSLSKSTRDRQYHDSDQSSRKRSRSETRSRSRSDYHDQYHRDRDREYDYDDRYRNDRHHRDHYRDTDHRSYSESRNYDDRSRSQRSRSRSHKDSYRRPIR